MDDVIIVGAGPAGANTALGLTKSGHSVTVIDSRTLLGDKVCTGIIGSECVDKYPPAPNIIFGEPTSAIVTTANGKEYYFSTSYPQASVIDRTEYVAEFSRQAQNNGAKYFLDERVTSINVMESHVKVSTTQRNLTARCVVVASGFGTSLLSQVGLSKSYEYMVGSQVEVEIQNIQSVRVYLDSLKTPGFFSWITPTTNNKGLVGVISDNKSKHKLEELLKHLALTDVIDKVCGPSRSWGIPLKPINQTYSDRVLVDGDAAGQIKPITGGGIFYSLLCGDIAASVLNECLRNKDLSAAALSEYEVLWKKEIGKEILSSYGIRKFVERIPRKIQSQLVRVAKAHSLIEDIIMNKGMFDLHSQIFSAMFSHPAVSWIFRKNSMDSQESKFVQDKIVEIGTNKQIEENELVSR